MYIRNSLLGQNIYFQHLLTLRLREVEAVLDGIGVGVEAVDGAGNGHAHTADEERDAAAQLGRVDQRQPRAQSAAAHAYKSCLNTLTVKAHSSGLDPCPTL